MFSIDTNLGIVASLLKTKTWLSVYTEQLGVINVLLASSYSTV